MMTVADLNAAFGIEDALRFVEGRGGLSCAEVSTAACGATVYLHGAHLTHWQPFGGEPVIFLSEGAAFTADKAIRGGVPVIFPWFGARQWAADGSARTDGPQHGFARTEVWEVRFAAMVGEDVHLTLALGPSEKSRALGYDGFQVVHELVMGRTLRQRLTVANTGEQPLRFEEALHSYFAAGGAEEVRLTGLAGTEYLDKTDAFKRKQQGDDALTLHGETDRPYLNTTNTVQVEDPALKRKITVAKAGSQSTVVWNPGKELAAKLPDLGDDDWQRFVCVETANVDGGCRDAAPSGSARDGSAGERGGHFVRLVLASASPRRRELLAQAGFAFAVQVAGIDETRRAGESPLDYVRRLAREKATAVLAGLGSSIDEPMLPQTPGASFEGGSWVVLGADTTVVLDGEVMNKPRDRADAERMLQTLSGRTHQVHTGVAVACSRCVLTHVESTDVVFRKIADAELLAYLHSGDGLDKAGAYGIQGYAARWIPRIAGDYFNVVGLPIAAVVHLLDKCRAEQDPAER